MSGTHRSQHVNAFDFVPPCSDVENLQNSFIDVTDLFTSPVTCMYTNSDTLDNKLCEFQSVVNLHKPLIIGITEAKPKHCRYQPSIASYSLKGYKLFNRNIQLSTGRGVLLYVCESLVVSEVNLYEDYEESVWAEVCLQNDDKLLVGVVYRSNSGGHENNTKLFDMFKSLQSLSYTHILVMGDFNMPGVNWKTFSGSNPMEDNFVEAVRDSFLYQHIFFPTRGRCGQSPNILDLVFSSEEGMISNVQYESPLGKSDHCVLLFDLTCYSPPSLSSKVRKCYAKGDFKKLRNKLDLDWDAEFLGMQDDVCSQWDRFHTVFEAAIEECIPTSSPSSDGRDRIPREFLNSFLKEKRKKSRCWQRFLESRFSDDHDTKWRAYCKQRNKVRALSRNIKKQKEKNVAYDAKTNPKKFWNYVGSKMKVKPGIPQLRHNTPVHGPTFTTNDNEKADMLLDHFSSVFTNEPDEEIPVAADHLVNSSLGDLVITEDMIQKKLLHLNNSKSPGPDQLHPVVLKAVASSLVKPLCVIFNTSIRTGKLPSDWKKAHISAVFKKGDREFPSNYRPISLTSIVCKILESLLRDHIVDYLQCNNLFSSKQYGFVPGRSTSLQLLSMLDTITDIVDSSGQVDIIYMDFQKAFDQVPHRRLIEKVKSRGIQGCILNWITDFLKDRFQQVIVNNCASSWAPVTSGIPQGSVLGPILFVLYVNDLPDCTSSDIYLFADDTKIFRSITCDSDSELLQHDLDELQSWSDKWLLNFHPDKCKVLTVGNVNAVQNNDARPYYLKKGNTPHTLEHVTEMKDLGVIIDNALSFDEHIQKIVSKANKLAGLIRRSFVFLDEVIFKRLFKAIVRPHLEYCHAVWNPHKLKHIDALENVQRRATRFVPSLKGLSYVDRLKKLNLPTLVYRRARGDMIETFKIFNKYDSTVVPHLHCNTSNTRGHAHKLFKLRANKNTRKNFFKLRICNLWNSLPSYVIESKDIVQFEKRLDIRWQNSEFKFDYRVAPPDHAKPVDATSFYQELDIEEPKILRPVLNLK